MLRDGHKQCTLKTRCIFFAEAFLCFFWYINRSLHNESATDLFYKASESKQTSHKFELIDSSTLSIRTETGSIESQSRTKAGALKDLPAQGTLAPENLASPPALHGKVEHFEEAPALPAFNNDAAGWLNAGRTIAALPFDKQVQIIGIGLSAGVEQYRLEDRERTIGAIIGSIQGLGNVMTNLAKIADFSAYCIIGDKDLGHLKSVGASAVYRILDNGHEIVIPAGAGKIQVLEEFLHSTQRKLGLLDNPEIPRSIAEIHVEDFMIRHSRFLGLTENDLQVLNWLKRDAVSAARKAGYIWRE